MRAFVVSKKSQKVEKKLSVLMLGIFICDDEWCEVWKVKKMFVTEN